MHTKNKILIVSGLLVALGGYYIYKNVTKKSTNAEESIVEDNLTFDTTKVLSKGSTGEEVKKLQEALKGGLVIDGNFGSLTEKRLKAITGQTSISLRDYNLFITNKSKK